MGEDICGWELFLKALCRFIRIGRKCSYIDECSHPRVRARRSDDGAAVRVPNQDYGTADPLQSPSHVGDILGVRIESVLRCDHLMSLGQKGRDEFAEARAVCPVARPAEMSIPLLLDEKPTVGHVQEMSLSAISPA